VNGGVEKWECGVSEPENTSHVWSDLRNKKIPSREGTCGPKLEPRISQTRSTPQHALPYCEVLLSRQMYPVFWPKFELGNIRGHSRGWHNAAHSHSARGYREVANETANCRRSRASISPGFKHNGIDP